MPRFFRQEQSHTRQSEEEADVLVLGELLETLGTLQFSLVKSAVYSYSNLESWAEDMAHMNLTLTFVQILSPNSRRGMGIAFII